MTFLGVKLKDGLYYTQLLWMVTKDKGLGKGGSFCAREDFQTFRPFKPLCRLIRCP